MVGRTWGIFYEWWIHNLSCEWSRCCCWYMFKSCRWSRVSREAGRSCSFYHGWYHRGWKKRVEFEWPLEISLIVCYLVLLSCLRIFGIWKKKKNVCARMCVNSCCCTYTCIHTYKFLISSSSSYSIRHILLSFNYICFIVISFTFSYPLLLFLFNSRFSLLQTKMNRREKINLASMSRIQQRMFAICLDLKLKQQLITRWKPKPKFKKKVLFYIICLYNDYEHQTISI